MFSVKREQTERVYDISKGVYRANRQRKRRFRRGFFENKTTPYNPSI